jgi:hypothetical protein
MRLRSDKEDRRGSSDFDEMSNDERPPSQTYAALTASGPQTQNKKYNI